jgi:hypothetical protein
MGSAEWGDSLGLFDKDEGKNQSKNQNHNTQEKKSSRGF